MIYANSAEAALWALGFGARWRSLLPAVRAAGEYPARDHHHLHRGANPGVSLLDGWSLIIVLVNGCSSAYAVCNAQLTGCRLCPVETVRFVHVVELSDRFARQQSNTNK
jgi:hypothetical protein